MASDLETITASDMDLNWALIAKMDDLNLSRPVLPISLNGKNYVLFKDDEGELGLIGRNCPHRGADLCFGRLEDNGLRCPFHGWHFDRTGQCVEQPAEPEGSKMYTQIKVPMIELAIRGDEIYAYIGEGKPPAQSNQVLNGT